MFAPRPERRGFTAETPGARRERTPVDTTTDSWGVATATDGETRRRLAADTLPATGWRWRPHLGAEASTPGRRRDGRASLIPGGGRARSDRKLATLDVPTAATDLVDVAEQARSSSRMRLQALLGEPRHRRATGDEGARAPRQVRDPPRRPTVLERRPWHGFAEPWQRRPLPSPCSPQPSGCEGLGRIRHRAACGGRTRSGRVERSTVAIMQDARPHGLRSGKRAATPLGRLGGRPGRQHRRPWTPRWRGPGFGPGADSGMKEDEARGDACCTSGGPKRPTRGATRGEGRPGLDSGAGAGPRERCSGRHAGGRVAFFTRTPVQREET
jgi:hypothetical protein